MPTTMRFLGPVVCVLAVGACLAPLGARAVAGQRGTSTNGDDADGLFRTELTLSSRQISVAYDPALRADDSVQAVLLAASSVSTEAGVLVARIEGHRALRIGPLGPEPEPEEAPSSGVDHDLWLTRLKDGWVLDARPVEQENATVPAESSRIPLRHRTTREAVDTLSAVLEPMGDDTGRMTLRWGVHVWATDFEFVELPRRSRPERTSNVGRPSIRTRDSDLNARYRATALGSRNETALRTTDGAHIQVLFQREVGTDSDDFPAIESTMDGNVLELTRSAAIRLRTEVPLQFGDTLVPTGNLAPNFPGAYALWLKKNGTDWRLVFNNEPDSWGTQHDPAFDAAELDLAYERVDGVDSDRPLAVYFVPLGAAENRLILHWGEHVWTVGFAVAQ